MKRIKMETPLVEMDGDEMTRVLWRQIKDILLLPYIDLKTEYYDLGLPNRDKTHDEVTVHAANRTRELGVAVKCATITANADRMVEYKLSHMWKSPNATIRAILDGTVFRAPILINNLKSYVNSWEEPITLARHAYGDIYKASEYFVKAPATVDLVVRYADGTTESVPVHEFDGPGVVSGMHNTSRSIEAFARACFQYAIDQKQDLWFSTKDTISKTYDHYFKDIFQTIYDNEYSDLFSQNGLSYFYTLIDDAVARVMRSKGGFIWACKNYDGDVMSDMIASANGSLAMMTSVLVSPDGTHEYEAAHGTITQHYYRYLRGEKTSSNPVATVFAWTGALARRGVLDEIPELVDIAGRIEKASKLAIEQGFMTGDLAAVCKDENPQILKSEEYLSYVKELVDSM